MTRIDPRFEAARQTNAAPCRGWDFSPSPAPRRNMLAIIASAVAWAAMTAALYCFVWSIGAAITRSMT